MHAILSYFFNKPYIVAFWSGYLELSPMISKNLLRRKIPVKKLSLGSIFLPSSVTLVHKLH